MEYRTLGRTSLKVSSLCLGTMTWGRQNNAEEAHAQIKMALERGVNLIDAAEMYPVPTRAETFGHTEAILGRWLHRYPHRDKIIIATKITGPSPRLHWIRNGKNVLDEKNIREAVQGSLQRLRTDYIDLYQLHWPHRKTNYFGKLGYQPSEENEPGIPLEESLRALQKMMEAGTIRHYGLSNETPWGLLDCLRAADKLGMPPPASIQNPYSLLNRVFETGNAEISHRESVSLLAYSPLAFGVLTGKYLKGRKPTGSRLALFGNQLNRYSSNESMSAANHYCRIAAKRNLTPAQLALAFTLTRPYLASAIIGATSLEQLEENLSACAVSLDADTLEEIEKVQRKIPNPAP